MFKSFVCIYSVEVACKINSTVVLSQIWRLYFVSIVACEILKMISYASTMNIATEKYISSFQRKSGKLELFQ